MLIVIKYGGLLLPVLVWLSLFGVSLSALVNCTLCEDPNASLGNPNGLFSTGQEVLRCQEMFDRGVLVLPEENCTSLQNLGEQLCLCNQPAPEITNCTLCEDGSPLVQPLLEGLPEETCAELQVDAQRDDLEHCGAHQATVGEYCLCNNPIASTNACRICSESSKLLDPLQIVVGMDGVNVSCGEIELEANRRLAGADGVTCVDSQTIYEELCCQNSLAPSMAPSDQPSGGRRRSSWPIWGIPLVGCALTLFP